MKFGRWHEMVGLQDVVLFSNAWPLVLVLTAFKVLAQFIYIIVWQRQKNCIPLYPIFSFYQVCLQIACASTFSGMSINYLNLTNLMLNLSSTWSWHSWNAEPQISIFFLCCNQTNTQITINVQSQPTYATHILISTIVGCSYTACWLWKYYDCMLRKYRSWKICVYNGNDLLFDVLTLQ